MKNNYAFIDGQNLHFGIKSLGWKLDHKKFRQYLEEEHGVGRAYIFLGFMEEHQDLYSVLQEAGFICYFKPLVRYDDGNIKGNVDADMVLQVMIDIDNYEQAVIISGDGDFSGMLRYLMFRKKLGRIIIPNRDKYSSLFDRLDGFDEKHVTFMNDLRSKLSYKPPKPADSPKSKHNKSIQQPSTPDQGPQFSGLAPNQNDNSQKRPHNLKTKSKPKVDTEMTRRKPNSSSKPRPTNKRRTIKKKTDGFKPKSELERSLIDTINSV